MYDDVTGVMMEMPLLVQNAIQWETTSDASFRSSNTLATH